MNRLQWTARAAASGSSWDEVRSSLYREAEAFYSAVRSGSVEPGSAYRFECDLLAPLREGEHPTQAERPINPRPSREEIEAGKSEAGGYTRVQLAAWGISWPPPKGWRKQLEREADEETARRARETRRVALKKSLGEA